MNSHSKHRFVQAAWKNAGMIHFDIKLHLFIVVSLAITLFFVHLHTSSVNVTPFYTNYEYDFYSFNSYLLIYTF